MILSSYKEVDGWLAEKRVRKPLLVCGRSIERLQINSYLNDLPERLGIRVIRFSDFKPNPDYSSAVLGVERFGAEGCDALIAVGGGSAMDVAKCIKLFSGMDSASNFLEQTIVPNRIPFLAVPTTAGTGSEATRFAVLYKDGEKQSIADYSCIPEAVFLDSSVLETLPLYQKKATMMDALCHAVESFWSVNSTSESRAYSADAIRQILRFQDAYLANRAEGNRGMLLAANLAGKAINITQTTAGHAMCYKITSLFGCAHGHAAALCNRALFPWMLRNTDKCADARGEAYLRGVLDAIGAALGGRNAAEGCEIFRKTVDELALETPRATPEQLELLAASVNPVRLKNHPIALDHETILHLYREMLR